MMTVDKATRAAARTHIEDAEAALRKLDRALGVPERAGGLLDDLEEATRQYRPACQTKRRPLDGTLATR